MVAKSKNFEKLGIPDHLADNCTKLGIKEPTDVQTEVIPLVAAGHDVFAESKTGSGKTAAYALPILSAISKDPFGVFCLVLTPTRELAAQISQQFRVLGAATGVSEATVCGGHNGTAERIALLERPHVVVATPGRLASHLQDSAVASVFRNAKFLVLDEADHLFEESFCKDLLTIFNKLPSSSKRQTLLFSATKNQRTEFAVEFRKEKMKKVTVSSDSKSKLPGGLSNYFLTVPRAVRECYLVSLLSRSFPNKNALVFVGRTKVCALLSETLSLLGFSSDALHSNLHQRKRVAAVEKFRAGKVRVLVCTDLAARGLDFPRVDLVINFNVPLMVSSFVHRCGRTARAGAKGISITLVSQYEIDAAKNIEAKSKSKMEVFKSIEPEKEILGSLRKVTNAKKVAQLRVLEYSERMKI